MMDSNVSCPSSSTKSGSLNSKSGEPSKAKDDNLSDAALNRVSLNGESAKPKDESLSNVAVTNGESSLNSNNDYSSLIGAVITQQMIQEEKNLEETILLEEKKFKVKIIEEQNKELQEECNLKLNNLLYQSSLYTKFMSDKLQRDLLKVSKKQERTEKRKAKGQSEGERKRQKGIDSHAEEENEDIEKVSNMTAEIAKVSNGQPSLLTGGVMHPYQLEGYEWLKVIFENGVNGILADEMGLGKTIQTIAFIAHLIEMGVTGPFFVCGPFSSVPNWHTEFQRFTPLIPTIIYHGDKETRAQLRDKINKKVKNGKVTSCPVFITSYQIALIDTIYLKKYNWKIVVIDEVHKIKHFQFTLISSLKVYKTLHRLLLTGMPLQNNLSELWSLLNFIFPDFLYELKVFESRIDVSRLAKDGGKSEIIAKEQEKQIISKIQQILTPFLLRRTKAETGCKKHFDDQDVSEKRV